MKYIKLYITFIAVLFVYTSCKKEIESSTINNSSYYASKEYAKKIEMRKKAQVILTEISNDRDVQEEILSTIDAITKKYGWRDEAVYFKEFLKDNFNSILNRPSITAQKFNLLAYKLDYPDYIQPSSLLPGQIPRGGTANNTLSLYLIDEDEEIYMPYHEDFTVIYNPTCTHQNLAVSETTNSGTIKVNNAINNRTVTDDYAQLNACWIVGSFDDNREIPATASSPSSPVATQKTILDPIWINWGYIKAQKNALNYEPLFKGGPEFRFTSTDINPLGTNAVPTSEVGVNFTRKECKKTTQKKLNFIIDQNWEILEFNKVKHFYEDDFDILSGLKNIFLPVQINIGNLGVNIQPTPYKTMNKFDDDMGNFQLNRSMFYNTNLKGADFGNGKDLDGWPYYTCGDGVFFSINRTIN